MKEDVDDAWGYWLPWLFCVRHGEIVSCRGVIPKHGDDDIL